MWDTRAWFSKFHICLILQFQFDKIIKTEFIKMLIHSLELPFIANISPQ